MSAAPDAGSLRPRPGGKQPEQDLPSRASILFGVALVWALAVLLRWLVADIPLERDEGEYAYAAQRWLAGDALYRDVFLHKPPAVVAVYAVVLQLFGATPAAIHWGAQVWTLGTLACIVWLGARWIALPAGIAAGLVAVLLTVDPATLGNSANTEFFAILPLTLGVLIAQARARPLLRAFGAGALGAAALAFKPVVAPVVGFTLLLLLAAPGARALRLLAWALGGLAVATPVAGAFVAAGTFAEFWDATVLYNLAYGSFVSFRDSGDTLALQVRALRPALWPVALAAALAPIVLLPPRRAGRGRRVAIAAGWLAAALLAVLAGGYLRRHYFVYLVPPLALLAGAGLHGVARCVASGRIASALAPLLALGIVAHAVAVSPWYYFPSSEEHRVRRIYQQNPFFESLPIAAWLAARSEPDDSIFIFGSEPQILFYAKRRSATRYMFVYPLHAPFGRVVERQREALREVREARPRFVVACFLRTSLLEYPDTPHELRAGVRELVSSSYRIVAATPFRPDGGVRFVEGMAAQQMWDARPLWDDGPPWASLVIWERRADD